MPKDGGDETQNYFNFQTNLAGVYFSLMKNIARYGKAQDWQ